MQAMYASGMPVAEIWDGPIHQAMTAIGNSWPHDKRAIIVEHRAPMLYPHSRNARGIVRGNRCHWGASARAPWRAFIALAAIRWPSSTN